MSYLFNRHGFGCLLEDLRFLKECCVGGKVVLLVWVVREAVDGLWFDDVTGGCRGCVAGNGVAAFGSIGAVQGFSAWLVKAVDFGGVGGVESADH